MSAPGHSKVEVKTGDESCEVEIQFTVMVGRFVIESMYCLYSATSWH